jgi:hypothetical protein
MKNIAISIGLVVLIGLSSCSNSATLNTSTPEEFGNTLIDVCRKNDSVAYSGLMATMDDMIKFVEESKKYKELKPNQQILVKALVESTFDSNNRHLKKSFHYVLDDFSHKGITDLNKIKVLKVESKDLSKDNTFWINTTFEVDGKQYVLRCENVSVIPGKGFRMNKDYPYIFKL